MKIKFLLSVAVLVGSSSSVLAQTTASAIPIVNLGSIPSATLPGGEIVINTRSAVIPFVHNIQNTGVTVNLLMSASFNSVLSGSHHRTLLDNGITQEGGSGFWATGDVARHDPNNSNISIGEVGAYRDVTPSLRLGLSVGINQNRQAMPAGGSGKSDTNYLVLEGDYQPVDSNISESATLYLGSNLTAISRGYLIGMTQNLSTGRTSGASWALRLRSDWRNAAILGGLEVSPYFSYTHGESQLNGYTETGGAFPIIFAAQQQSSDEIRAGVTLLSKLTGQTDLRFPLELAYRTNSGSDITGLVAATPFFFRNVRSAQGWARAGVELDQHLSKQTLLNGALLVAGRGGDSSWLGTVSMKHAF